MDGRFVPNLTFGAKVIDALRRVTNLPLDCHLMVVEPERYFETFVESGASVITIHAEASPHLHRQIARIKELGCIAGVAINPATSLETVREIAPDLDLLLIMTVNPGFGGQRFIPGSVDKVRRARRLLDDAGSKAALQVDGGIARETIRAVWRAGADTVVAGNAVFSATDPAGEIRGLRARCAEQA
jgi:ribulose-phosphate 3-epimerase